MKFEGLGHGLSVDLLAAANAIVLESGDYKKFFQAALKKFGVTSPAELKGDKEKEFYAYIDKNWDGKDEKEEVKEAAKWKMGDGKPRGGANIENVRFWDLPKASLEYIQKDSKDAMKANPSNKKNTQGKGNYADQINDAQTVLIWRKKNNIKESVKIEEVLPTPIDGVAESETFNEKAGKYAKYSDLLMQKARLVAQGPVATKEVTAINKKIASEIKKLGIKEDKGFEKILMSAFSGE